MSMLGGLFGGKEQHPNFERISHALLNHLGYTTAPPSAEVLALLEQLTPREMLNFDNMHSLQGIQALFKARSLRADVDTETSTITISPDSAEAAAAEGAPETPHAPTIHPQIHQAKFHVEPPNSATSLLKAGPAAVGAPGVPPPPVPTAFQHLEAFEHLTEQLIDLLLRNGRINTGDKEVLKKIHPLESTMQGRVIALERWKAELTHRIRGLNVPKTAERITLGAAEPAGSAEAEESLARRFETLQLWTSKLIKAIEHEGVKFHNTPLWLPH